MRGLQYGFTVRHIVVIRLGVIIGSHSTIVASDEAMAEIVPISHCDSPGGSMQRGQHTFRPDNKEDRHTCLQSTWIMHQWSRRRGWRLFQNEQVCKIVWRRRSLIRDLCCYWYWRRKLYRLKITTHELYTETYNETFPLGHMRNN